MASLQLGPQVFSSWQDVLDKVTAFGFTNPVVQSDRSVLATDPSTGGQVIIGVFAPGAIPGTGANVIGLIGESATPMAVQPDGSMLPVLFPADAPALNTGQGTPGLNPVPIYTAFGAGPPGIVDALQQLLTQLAQALNNLGAVLGLAPWVLLAGAGVLIIAAHHRR